jgi:uncharacterized protein
MVVTREQHAVESIEQLRAIISTPAPDAPARRKDIQSIDHHCRAFIEKSPFLLLSTASSSGRCDVSPRGDGPGFVKVLDDHTVVVPDRPGNRRLDSFENIIDNRHAGLIFMVPNVDETLRINGRAWLTNDPDLMEQMAMQGKVPQLGVVVEAQEVFFHCARAFKRAKLWNTESWIERSELPTLGQILHDQLKREDITAREYDESLEESNRKLY